MDQLEGGFGRALTLVCAPPGSGKTALLAEWSQEQARPVAWLSLDAGDNDAVRFWRHVAAALDRARPGVAEYVESLTGAAEPPSFEGLATAAINSLDADDGELLLVLDDYHVIESEAVHQSLRFVLEHAPAALHVAVASRADPEFPLGRLRASGELTELRAADLRFTADEAAVLLREAVGPVLDGDVVGMLAARTEGWAAGLQLAALSLQGRSEVSEFVTAFSGTNRYVVDYLTEEVLDRQPEPVREFLVETSMLDRLSGPLCDAVTGRSDSQQMLEAIDAANLFLAPLDDARGWWRYHHLFGDMLRARLLQRPDRARELHHDAATWHERYGSPDESVRHALEAGESLWAAQLIERHADELLLSSEGATLQRWLVELPPDVTRSRARLLVAQARMAMYGGRIGEAEELLDAAERAPTSPVEEPFEPSVGTFASPLVNVPGTIAGLRAFAAHMRGEADEATALASRIIAETGDEQWMLTRIARWHLATAEWLRGEAEEAERAVTADLAEWRAAGQHDRAAWSSHYLGRIQRARGHLDVALGTYRRVLEVDVAGSRRRFAPGAGVALVGMAEVSYERNELDLARHHATEGIALCRQFLYSQALATGLATLAWIGQVEGDSDGARTTIEEAVRVGPSSEAADLLNPVPAQWARLLLAQGDIAAAAQWTAERGVGVDEEPRYVHEPAYLVLARVLLAQERFDLALPLLHRLYVAATAQGRVGSVIEIQMLRALAQAAAGEDADAVAALAESLTLAHAEGYARVFVDEGPPMATLLGRLIATQSAEGASSPSIPFAYLSGLVQMFEQAAAGSAAGPAMKSPAGVRLVTPLSDRELEVLRLMATGRQNQEIAREIYVSLNTVKKHVTHILEKLGAANRTEATSRARQLGLLLDGEPSHVRDGSRSLG